MGFDSGLLGLPVSGDFFGSTVGVSAVSPPACRESGAAVERAAVLVAVAENHRSPAFATDQVSAFFWVLPRFIQIDVTTDHFRWFLLATACRVPGRIGRRRLV